MADITGFKLRQRLSARAVATLKRPGFHADGGGLYIQVTRTGAKSWVLRYQRAGRARWMGLGSASLVPLAEARAKAIEARRLLLDGIDPIDDRRARLRATSGGMTFRQAAARHIESHRAGWKNPKHASQWTATLETYAYPVFGDLDVSVIDTGAVMRAIEPIWPTKTETASRVRGRIEAVLDWAKARGHREGENPARWKGHLDNLLTGHPT